MFTPLSSSYNPSGMSTDNHSETKITVYIFRLLIQIVLHNLPFNLLDHIMMVSHTEMKEKIAHVQKKYLNIV